mmetsp:Transcript_20966/g.54946  ORF Transcript_20966/g.54946 Transcript_20966/m.54946 type:complete len:267 (+) Transcript_20966:1624-2424(+)
MTKGHFRFFNSSSDSTVCGSSPCMMSITRIARSHSDEPRFRRLLKDSWPGVSITMMPGTSRSKFGSTFFVCSCRAMSGKNVAPICWVMPPASPSCTFVLRILSSSLVFPVSTWPMMTTMGERRPGSESSLELSFDPDDSLSLPEPLSESSSEPFSEASSFSSSFSESSFSATFSQPSSSSSTAFFSAFGFSSSSSSARGGGSNFSAVVSSVVSSSAFFCGFFLSFCGFERFWSACSALPLASSPSPPSMLKPNCSRSILARASFAF